MSHKKHQQGGSSSNAQSGPGTHRQTGKKVREAKEQMSTEFPSYNALEEGGPAGESWKTSEHRADTSRMSHSQRTGGTSARRSPDPEAGPARGESTGEIRAELVSEQPGRGESTAGDDAPSAIWDGAEAQQPARGESIRAELGGEDLTMSGFAQPARGESTGRGDDSAEMSEAPKRGESTRARGR